MKIVDKTSKCLRKSDTDDITYRIQGHVAIMYLKIWRSKGAKLRNYENEESKTAAHRLQKYDDFCGTQGYNCLVRNPSHIFFSKNRSILFKFPPESGPWSTGMGLTIRKSSPSVEYLSPKFEKVPSICSDNLRCWK